MQPPGAPAGYAYRDAILRPGVIPLRPLQLGDIYGAMFKVVRGNPGATFGLATLVTFVAVFPFAVLSAVLAGSATANIFDETAVVDEAEVVTSFVALYLPIIGQVIASVIGAGALAYVVGQAVMGRRLGLGEAWRATLPRLLPIIGAVLLVIGIALLVVAIGVGPGVLILLLGSSSLEGVGIALVILGAIATMIVLFVLTNRWAMATAAVMLEQAGPVAALRRSWALVGSPLRQPFWRVFGIRLLTSLLVSTAVSIVLLPLSMIGGLVAGIFFADSGNGALTTITIVSGFSAILTGILTTPFVSSVDALLYVDLRMRREGLDVALIQYFQGASTSAWPTTNA